MESNEFVTRVKSDWLIINEVLSVLGQIFGLLNGGGVLRGLLVGLYQQIYSKTPIKHGKWVSIVYFL